MAEQSSISWTDHTWSPWFGCTQVSMGPRGACEGCYARHMHETRFKRVVFGGPGRGEGTRDIRADEAWREPLRWEREAAAVRRAWFAPEGEPRGGLGGAGPRPPFVFPSMCDPFDNHPALREPRRRFFDLIRATPHLTWLLLTKRPGNIVKMWLEVARAALRPNYGDAADTMPVEQVLRLHPWPGNAAIGCTVVSQEEADRDVPRLLAAKAALKPPFAFLSMEPLLGPVLLGKDTPTEKHDYLSGDWWEADADGQAEGRGPAIDWVITGGETDQGKHRARPTHPDWILSIRDQCTAAGVPFHHKQHGDWKPIRWMADGESDDLYYAPPKRDPEAIRRCKVEHTVMNRDGSLHPSAADPETYHAHHGSMMMFKVGPKRAGRLIDGVEHNAMPTVSA